MTKENPNYYSIMPANVRYDNDLTPNAKLLYSEITSLCNMNGDCFATNNYFAKLYGVSVQSISKWINILIKKGYINSKITYKKDSKEIDKRYITLIEYPIKEKFNTPIKEKFNTPIKEKFNTPIKEKFNTPIKEKFKDNNTNKLDINNKYKKIVNKLKDILEKNYNRRFKTDNWYKEIDKMVRIDNISLQNIEQILDWYSGRIGGDYIPVVQSAKTFREKYIKLTDAIKRDVKLIPSNQNTDDEFLLKRIAAI